MSDINSHFEDVDDDDENECDLSAVVSSSGDTSNLNKKKKKKKSKVKKKSPDLVAITTSTVLGSELLGPLVAVRYATQGGRMLVASESITAGTVVFKESPIAVISPSSRGNHSFSTSARLCDACGLIFSGTSNYCCEECSTSEVARVEQSCGAQIESIARRTNCDEGLLRMVTIFNDSFIFSKFLDR